MSCRTPRAGYGRNIELVRRYQAGDTRAAEELLALNAPMIAEMVLRVQRFATSMEFDDLAQEARLGLLTAAQKFDITSGNRFSTYAYWWVRQSMQRAMGNQDRLIRWPLHVTNQSRRLACVPEVLPAVVFSLDDDCGDPGRGEMAKVHDIIAAPGDLEQETVSADFVKWALGGLRPQERLVMERRLDGWLLADIGRELGVTRSRVQQIASAAAERVRNRMVAAGCATPGGLL